jgi:hypothetical protein
MPDLPVGKPEIIIPYFREIHIGKHAFFREKWRAPSERIRTASEIPIEVDLTDEDAVPAYMKVSEKVLHLRRLGMPYTSIAERIGVNLWMAKRAARWAKIHNK